MHLLVRFVCISLVLWGGVAGSVGKAEEPRSNALSSAVLTSQQKGSSPQPLWHLDIQRNEPKKDFLGPRVVSDQKRVFYLQGGFVKAVSAKTGRQLWAFRVGKWAQLRYSSGWLLAVSYSGEVIALEPRTGKVDWRKTAIYANFTAAGDTFYAADPRGVEAFDLITGQFLWRTAEPFFSPTSTVYNNAPLTVVDDFLFVQGVYFDAISTSTHIYRAKTGKFLLRTSSFGPVAAIEDKVFFVGNFPGQLDYPDLLNLDVYNSRTGKITERVYSVKNRARGNDWNSKVAVTNAVYISGGGNLACFPLAAPGGQAKPNFVGVPQGDVQWLAGPQDGTFVLEWRGALWLVQQNPNPCAPIDLLKQGLELDKGILARIDAVGNGLYLGLKNGHFYAVDSRTARVVFKLSLRSPTFGPTQVIGDTLVVQSGSTLLTYPLPEALKP